jgi:hypothetical protein
MTVRASCRVSIPIIQSGPKGKCMSATFEVPRLSQEDRSSKHVAESSVPEAPGSWQDDILGLLGVIVTLFLLGAGAYVVIHDLI